MKKSLVLAMAMALGVSAVALAANPFSDVPTGHWAYGAVAKLAAQGVVEGYGDGTFEGTKAITRYEMAQIIAKAMAKGAVKSDDKLVAEFQQELQSLGVRIAKLEKKVDNVKISGEIRASYADFSGKLDGSEDIHGSKGALRSRIFFTGDVNKNWTYQAMLQNDRAFSGGWSGDVNSDREKVTFQRAFVTGKYGDFKVKAGRYEAILHDGNFYDNMTEALYLEYGKDLKFSFAVGKLWDLTSGLTSKYLDKIEGISSTAAGTYYDLALRYDQKNWGAALEYTNAKDLYAKDSNVDNKLFSLGAYYKFGAFKLDALWLRGGLDGFEQKDPANLKENNNGVVIGLSYKGAQSAKPGTWGLYGKYYNQGNGTVLGHCMNGYQETLTGFCGYMLGANLTVAKNMVAAVEWYDFKLKDGIKKADGAKYRTLWTQLVFNF